MTDPESFESFAVARLESLRRFGWAIAGDRSLGDDLVMEALVRVAVRWPKVAKAGNPERYIKKVIVNLRVSWWRKSRREIATEIAQMSDEGYLSPEANHELRVALRALPPRQRAVLVLRYYEDLSERETAELLECSIGTVKSQASKALAKLRINLPDFELEDHK